MFFKSDHMRMLARNTPANDQLSCRGRLQELDLARNRGGGPGQLQRLVGRLSYGCRFARFWTYMA